MMRVTTLKAGVDGQGAMIEYDTSLAREQHADQLNSPNDHRFSETAAPGPKADRGWDGRTNGCPKRSISAKDGWLPLAS
jgi:hypothetical protein